MKTATFPHTRPIKSRGSDFQSRPLGFRTVLITSALAHAVIIGVIIIAERSLHEQKSKPQSIVFIPAAPRGELPRGSAVGIGEAPRGNNPNPALTQNVAPTPRAQTPSTPTRPTQSTPTPTRTIAPTHQTIQRPTRTPAAPTTQPTRLPTTSRNTAQTSAPAQPRPQTNVADIRNQLLQGMQNNAPAGIPDGATRGSVVGARGTPAGGGVGRGRTGDPSGSSVGILGGSGAGTPFWDYHLHIHDVLYAAWQQPSQFADPLRPPTARVRLRIAKDGSLWEAKLAQSSGIREVDESALSAARGTRLNPPPSAMLGGKDFVEITVAFKLGGNG